MFKQKQAIIFFSILIIVLVVAFIISDDKLGAGESLEVQFSKDTGFYNENFYLELSVDSNAKIYYTLDGSIPNQASACYTTPIYISDASLNENVYSKIKEVSPGLCLDRISQYSNLDRGYKLPVEKVDKCTILRAIAIDEEGKAGDIATRAYFVDFDKKAGYENVKLVCITAAPDELFGYDNGIYVTGKSFDEYYESERFFKDGYGWDMWKANYYDEGKTADANITILDNNKELINCNASVAIKGRTSVSYNTKSLNIKFKKYQADIFGDGHMQSGVSIETCGQDQIIYMRDKFMNDLALNSSAVAKNYEPAVLFLNGEYWGYCYITQNYGEDYFEEYYNISNNNLIEIKNTYLKATVEEDYKKYEELMDYIENTDMSIQDNYDYFCSIVDIQSLIDYYIYEIYINNNDWDIMHNYAIFCDKTGTVKWKWILFDLNSSTFELGDAKSDMLQEVISTDSFLRALFKNENFKEQFISSFYRHLDKDFDYEACRDYIEQYRNMHMNTLIHNSYRFYGASYEEEINKEMDNILLYIELRNEHLRRQLDEI